MDQRSKLNIAVCDDDIFVTEQLSEWIKEYFVSNHLEEPNIYEFDNGENLIKSEVKYDFVFLDIVIPGKYSLQGTTQSRYLTGGVPPVRFSM